MLAFNDYIHQVCPHCKSKRIKKVVFIEEEFIATTEHFYSAHFFCKNCKRILYNRQIKWVLDKHQMSLDIQKLKRYRTKKIPRWYK